MIRTKVIRYSLEKNEQLKEQRNIGFEDVLLAIENGGLLDDIEHPNKEKYPNQNIFIILVEIKEYVYLVPYVEDDESIFLKTIIPSRQMNKKYNKTISIVELPTFARNTQIQIFVEDRLINQFIVNPSEEFLENQVNFTINILDELFANDQNFKKEFSY